jgi:hypothetical protein
MGHGDFRRHKRGSAGVEFSSLRTERQCILRVEIDILVPRILDVPLNLGWLSRRRTRHQLAVSVLTPWTPCIPWYRHP